MMQIAQLMLGVIVGLGALFGWLWAKGQIEGTIITRLDIADSDIKEIKANIQVVASAKSEDQRKFIESLGQVRERLAVMEFRVAEIDKQLTELRRDNRRKV